MAGYVSVLDLGIQSAIGRYVAYYLANQDGKSAEEFVSTSFNVLCIIALLGFGGLVLAGIYLHAIFPQIPRRLLGSTQTALVLLGIGVSLGLPASSFRGILAGIERYELVTFIAAPTGLLLSGALIVLALSHFSLIVLAIAFATIKVLSYGSYWVVSQVYGRLKITLGTINRASVVELWSFCSSTIIWSIGALAASGLDVAIVARLDFAHVAAYSACVGPVMLIAGAQNAMFRPLLQAGSRYFAKGDMESLHSLMEKSTRIALITIVLSVTPIIFLGHQILTIWLGSSYANQATLILRLLLVGQAIRLVATPYATLLLATDNHRATRIPVLFDATSNTVAALLFGIRYGADGVAFGVIVGAIVGLLMNIFYTYPRTRKVAGDGTVLLCRAILIPLICFAPLALIPVAYAIQTTTLIKVPILVALVGSCIYAIWKFALAAAERHWLHRIVSQV